MYNNHHQGIYTIRGDMCYENKLMANVGLPERPMEATCLTLPENEHTAPPESECKRGRFKFLTFPTVSSAIIIVIVLVSLFLLEYGYIPQKKLGYYCKDPTISQPFNGDTITWVTLCVGTLFAPLIILMVIEYDNETCFSRSCCLRVWYWYRDFLIGSIFNLTIVEVVKTIVGEHRPHFMNTCVPTHYDSCEIGTYVTDYTCTTTKYSRYFEIDSSRSFPSGHTSLSVFTAFFCAAYIHNRLNIKKTGIIFKIFLIFLCITWSLLCSLTRITDHRHHWWDVLFGAFVGIFTVFYTVHYLCRYFVTDCIRKTLKPTPSASTTALLDLKNKDATSVII